MRANDYEAKPFLTSLLSAPALAVGRQGHYGDFELRRFAGDGGLTYWLAIPDELDLSAPPIVAVHGFARAARQQARRIGPRACRRGRLVVGPYFDEAAWPKFQQVVRYGRADRALIKLMDRLASQGLWRTERFDLCGFSGGAQFAHRFTMLYPERVGQLTCAAAGWYTFPDETPFPYGFGPRPHPKRDWGQRMKDNFAAFLDRDIIVAAGELDNKIDANTRGGEALNAQQGVHRLERALRWSEAVQAKAHAQGLHAKVSFHVLPEVGHNFRLCVKRARLDRLIVP